MDGDQSLALNRVDLISRTIETLEKIYREKEECKARASDMSQAGNNIAAARQAIKDDRVSYLLIDNATLILLYVFYLTLSSFYAFHNIGTFDGSISFASSRVDNNETGRWQHSIDISTAVSWLASCCESRWYWCFLPIPPNGTAGSTGHGLDASGYGSQVQGNLRDDFRFHQGYLRAMHDGANLGSGLGLGRQEAKSQRGRMK